MPSIQENLKGKEQKRRLPPPVALIQDVVYSDQTDTSGRPLMELNTNERGAIRARAQHIPFEMKACPFDDSREGKSMNYSAFEQMGQRMKQIEDAFAWLGRKVIGENEQVTLHQASVLGNTGYALAAYAFNRAERPRRRYRDLPIEVANVTKILNGLRMITIALQKEGMSADAVVTPQELYRESDKKRLFDSAMQRVCSAPPPMIVNLLSTLFYKDFDRSTETVGLLETEFADIETIRDNFAQPYAETQRVIGKLAACLLEGLDMSEDSYLRKYVAHEEELIPTLTELQAQINNALGRSVEPAIKIGQSLRIFNPGFYKMYEQKLNKVRQERKLFRH